MLVLLEFKTVVLPLPQLVEIVVEGLFGHADLGSSCLESVDALALGVHLLVEPTPVTHEVPRLPDCPFLHLLFLLGGIGRLGQSCSAVALLGGSEASESHLDGCVEEEFILEVQFLFEREESEVNVEFPGEIEIEDVAVGKVES